jgi:hypothetical protein
MRMNLPHRERRADLAAAVPALIVLAVVAAFRLLGLG